MDQNLLEEWQCRNYAKIWKPFNEIWTQWKYFTLNYQIGFQIYAKSRNLPTIIAKHYSTCNAKKGFTCFRLKHSLFRDFNKFSMGHNCTPSIGGFNNFEVGFFLSSIALLSQTSASFMLQERWIVTLFKFGKMKTLIKFAICLGIANLLGVDAHFQSIEIEPY